ncbi:MAG: stage III sporulation protein AB [Clostridia bacterium]|nr:stage III sporulation protein AB [Clostridia bacterium]
MRLLGAFVCFLVSLSWGISAGKTERARTAECEAFLELFAYIQNQIGYFFAPTKLIYKHIENDVLSRVGFLQALATHETDEVYFDVWTSALNACKGNLHLTEAQLAIVQGFGACIGKSNEELQLKTMAYYTRALAAETEKQKSEMKKNIKVYRTLGFAVGAATVILVV